MSDAWWEIGVTLPDGTSTHEPFIQSGEIRDCLTQMRIAIQFGKYEIEQMFIDEWEMNDDIPMPTGRVIRLTGGLRDDDDN